MSQVYVMINAHADMVEKKDAALVLQLAVEPEIIDHVFHGVVKRKIGLGLFGDPWDHDRHAHLFHDRLEFRTRLRNAPELVIFLKDIQEVVDVTHPKVIKQAKHPKPYKSFEDRGNNVKLIMVKDHAFSTLEFRCYHFSDHAIWLMLFFITNFTQFIFIRYICIMIFIFLEKNI